MRGADVTYRDHKGDTIGKVPTQNINRKRYAVSRTSFIILLFLRPKMKITPGRLENCSNY